MTTRQQSMEEEILHIMFRLGRMFARRRHQENGEPELSMLQLQALIFIAERQSCSMSDLAGEFQIGLPSATALVDRLVRADLLSRAEDPNDRRVTRVRLTAAGRERLRRLRDREVSELRTVIDNVSVEDRQALVRIMTHVLDRIDATA